LGHLSGFLLGQPPLLDRVGRDELDVVVESRPFGGRIVCLFGVARWRRSLGLGGLFLLGGFRHDGSGGDKPAYLEEVSRGVGGMAIGTGSGRLYA
jgi:hypothetical protein